MNLILFDSAEITVPLPRRDPRAIHLLTVLRRQPGEPFDAGIVNGPRGKGRIVTIDDAAITLAFAWDQPPAPPAPIVLIVGLPRPQTARDILREATALGIEALHFVVTDRGEPGYAQSTLWRGGEWRRHVRAGAEQAFCTREPEVSHGGTLAAAIAGLGAAGGRCALDNYEASEPLARLAPLVAPVTLCLGSERGWSGAERELLRAAGFRLVHLGSRVLRIETACIAALTLVRARLGLMGA